MSSTLPACSVTELKLLLITTYLLETNQLIPLLNVSTT